VSFAATPRVVPAGAMVLQPSDERRRSGSHYTPRTLTEPIVETTFRPILERLGPNPTPEQILDLKICDPAMGSGAFLVAVCRFLAELLVKAWHAHNCVPTIPPDEDEILHARRVVAQRCHYGVDKNPMAVDLAKLSLWLATLAKDHPFTFLDHALRHGDSLVGLTKKQIEAFHWKSERQRDFARNIIEDRISRATTYRREIREAAEATPESLLSQKLALAEEALNPLRFYGDLVIAAFFSESNDRQRKTELDELAEQLKSYLTNAHKLELRKPLDEARRELLEGEKAVYPFHWEIEFPEVFDRENSGFDTFVGNPPFAGKNTLASGHAASYPDWLKAVHDESHGNADLVAHFFRRAFSLLRTDGCFGLIATNTIGQGDTRSTGLRWICRHGGEIFAARKRIKWPGLAAVVVSIVHVKKGSYSGTRLLDNDAVPTITAFLFYGGGHDDPYTLTANQEKAFIGSQPYGMGFTFDDTDQTGTTSIIGLMNELISSDKHNAERIFPFIGYSEVASNPDHRHYRYIIDFGEMSEEEARRWPDLIKIVEENVKPARAHLTTNAVGRKRAENWWQYGAPAKGLYDKIAGLKRVLVAGSQASAQFAFAFLPTGYVYSSNLTVIACDTYAAFAAIQS
jgi:hypothetical protein